MQPQNAIIGDDSLPGIAEKDLQAERNMANFTNSPEWKNLVDHFQNRIAFYQGYFPGGTPIEDAPVVERDAYWVAAKVIISEFQAVISSYDVTTEAVEDAQ